MSCYHKNYFNFKLLNDKYLVTNDTGRFVFLDGNEFQKLINDGFDDPELIDKLKKAYVIYDKHRELFVDEVSAEVRKQKAFLFEGTQLHIFILTKECNQKCIYCQASASHHSDNSLYMSKEIAEKAVDIAFQSHSRNLSFEFQGGEPLLNFPVLKHIVEYVNTKNMDGKRIITFNLVSNLIILNDEMLEFLLQNNVSICTSLDGDEALHKTNRPCQVKEYFKTIKQNISQINEMGSKYGNQFGKVQALQTTTRLSLSKAKNIVDEYVSTGFNALFLRPLTPLGMAKDRWENIGYTPEEFLAFYEEAFMYILKLASSGVNIREAYATILLKKIFGNTALNYMELRSPCGGAIGQLAYHYNGNIYTCDEGRMLSESGDESFKVGDVFSSTYNDLIESDVTKALCIASCLETIPGCQECLYSPYCGVCPILNYAQEGSIFSIIPANYKCKINKGILDLIFRKIGENDGSLIDVFNKWIT
jgi:His-Xaa-Ser repeat-associated upstream radical SAM protein